MVGPEQSIFEAGRRRKPNPTQRRAAEFLATGEVHLKIGNQFSFTVHNGRQYLGRVIDIEEYSLRNPDEDEIEYTLEIYLVRYKNDSGQDQETWLSFSEQNLKQLKEKIVGFKRQYTRHFPEGSHDRDSVVLDDFEL